MTVHTRRLTTTLIAGALLAACTTTTPGGTVTTTPAARTGTGDGAALLARVESALTAHEPGLVFAAPETTRAACGSSGTLTIMLAVAPAPVPDAAWPAAVADVERVVREHGLTQRTVLVDAPGHHDVSFDGPGGGRVVVGTQQRTTVSVETACSQG